MRCDGGYVYINTTTKNTALYVGVTSDLTVRDYQHKKHVSPNSFTKRYNIDKLVYFERYESMVDAIRREKEIKGWRRDRKIALIKKVNPEFKELSFYRHSERSEAE